MTWKETQVLLLPWIFFHLTLMHLALVYYFSNIISLQIDIYKTENKQQKVMKFESSSQRKNWQGFSKLPHILSEYCRDKINNNNK